MRRRFLELIRPLSSPDLRRVWLAQATSDLGDWAAVVAVAVLILDRTGSATLTGAVFAVSVAPAFGIGPALATLGDRLPRRTVMLATDLIRGALVLAMVVPMPSVAVLALLFLVGLAGAPFRAARAALIPDMVPLSQYHDALVLRSLTEQGAVLLGYAAGGGLVAVIGARGALAVNAATFFVSAALLARLGAGRTRPVAVDGDGAVAKAGVRPAFAWIRRDLRVRSAAVIGCTVAGCAMVGESSTVVYATEALGESGATAGLLSAAIPVGTIAAGVFSFDPLGRAPLRRIGALAAGAGSVAVLAFALDLPLPWILVAYVAIGAVFATGILANTLFGALVPAGIRASAFGLLQAAFTGCEALGALLGGFFAETFGVRITCTVALGVAGAIGFTALVSPTPAAPAEAAPAAVPTP